MKYITSVLLDPWRDWERTKIMLAGVIGCFGVCMLSLTLAYHFAGADIQTNLTYHVPRLVIGGLVTYFISFWLIARRGGRWWLALFQISGALLFLVDPTAALPCGLGFAIANSPFWSCFNTRFALQQSLKNNAREMALGMYLMTMMGALGTWFGGFMLQHGHYNQTLILGLCLVVITTQILFQPFPSQNLVAKAWKSARSRRPTSRLSFFIGCLNVAQDYCMPLWFRTIGLSPLSTGTFLALQPILGFLFTPLCGNLVQKGTLSSVRLAGIANACGWGLMMATVHVPWLLAPTLGFLSVCQNVLITAEATRWFKNRTPVGITVREALLGTGRGVAIFCVVPIAIFLPALYPLVGVAVSLTVSFGVFTKPLERCLAKTFHRHD